MLSLSSRVASAASVAHNHRQQRNNALRVYAARPPSGDDSEGGGGKQPKNKKELYEVKVTTPPERSLGLHKFPNNMSCGETIELRRRYFVVGSHSRHSPSRVYARLACLACVRTVPPTFSFLFH